MTKNQLEKRARFHQRAFELAAGLTPTHATIDDLIRFVNKYYP